MKKNNFITIAMVFICFGFWSCSQDDEPDSKSIIGTWSKTIIEENKASTFYATFKENGNIEYQVTGNKIDETFFTGTYIMISEDEIEVKDANCIEDDSEDFIVGKYKLVITENTLEFILIKDKCNRSEDLPGVYNKVKQTNYTN